MKQLGLADLGNTLRAAAGQAYVQVSSTENLQIKMISGFSPQDGDNNLDICLDMGEVSGALQVNQNPFLFPKRECDFDSSGGCCPDTTLRRGEQTLSTKGETFRLFTRSGHSIDLYIY